VLFSSKQFEKLLLLLLLLLLLQFNCFKVLLTCVFHCDWSLAWSVCLLYTAGN